MEWVLFAVLMAWGVFLCSLVIVGDRKLNRAIVQAGKR